MKSSSSSSPRIIVALFTALIISLLLIGLYTDDHNNALLLPHRKLLQLQNDAGQVISGNETERGLEPNRVWSDKCSKSDIVISQGPTEPLPNGIPTYTVEMINVCISGCDISDIHLTCGWFSSARLINPRVFKRLGFNDCLVNNGTSLAFGRTLSFRYANTFPYSFSVSSLRC